MPQASTLLVFAAASLAFLVVPGPSVLFVVTRSLEQGSAAGVMSAVGVQAGGLVHVGAAVLGLSALLASSATAFSIVKYAGAAYLIFLGVQRLRRPRDDRPAHEGARSSRASLFRQGLVVNALNPKTAIFFLAFLPQFADPDRGPIAPQIAVLGTCFLALATVSDGTYALVAGSIGTRLRRSEGLRRRMDRVGGLVFIALGAGAALSGDHARSG